MPKQIIIESTKGKNTLSMLTSYGMTLEGKFKDYAAKRRPKESEWQVALSQYEGVWDADDRTKIEQALGFDNNQSMPTVNITRPKTNVATARMQDIQFPTGTDYNFSIKPQPHKGTLKQAMDSPEPSPELEQVALEEGFEGKVPSPQEVVEDILEAEWAMSRSLQNAIRTSFIQSNYGREAHLAMEDLCKLGTACIKGPTLQNIVIHKYSEGKASSGKKVQVLSSTTEEFSEIVRVDIRLLYPDPAARLPTEIKDIFEVHLLSEGELQDLAFTKSFMKDQIKIVLELGNDASEHPSILATKNSVAGTGLSTEGRWIVKEYHGQLNKDALFEGGIISESDRDDVLKRFVGEAWVINGVIIRMALNQIEGEQGIPYHFTIWERDEGSVFGHGVPFLLRHPSRVVNNSFIMLLDNASLISGPQVILNEKMIQPASKDGDYGIYPHKIWLLTEYGADVREAMQFVDIPAQMEPISAIIDLAMQFADIESAVPMLSQGEVPSVQTNNAGLAIVTAATTISQKRANASWDEYITKPLVRRQYHFERQYGDLDIEGDFEIEVGGATERIDAQTKAQELERTLGLAQSNEEFLLQIDPPRAFRQLVTLNRAGDILRTPQEIVAFEQKQQEAAAAAAESDPNAMKAQAALILAQAAQLTADALKSKTESDIKINTFEAREKAQIGRERVLAEREGNLLRAEVADNEREARLIENATKNDLDASKLAVQLQTSAMTNKTEREKIAAELTAFREEVQLKREEGEGI